MLYAFEIFWEIVLRKTILMLFKIYELICILPVHEEWQIRWQWLNKMYVGCFLNLAENFVLSCRFLNFREKLFWKNSFDGFKKIYDFFSQKKILPAMIGTCSSI